MAAFALREIQPHSYEVFVPASRPELTVVDAAELRRVTLRVAYLQDTAKRSLSKDRVFFTSTAGRLSQATMAKLLESGLPRIQRGLKSYLKEDDYATRLAGLRRLEELEFVLTTGRNYYGALQFEQVTPAHLAWARGIIDSNKAYYVAPDSFEARWNREYLPYI